MNAKLFNTLLVVLTVSIVGCLLSVALTELTARETTLLGIVLTILSFIASWVVSKYFADQSHKKAIDEVKEQHLSNLRTYALNAAEKVNTLSSELAKLSVYLQQEIEDNEEDEANVEELYLSSYERIESAIHIINTLKSVNDTYLSDWKGVIGEELDEKIEEQQEREKELRELVEKAKNIIISRPQDQLQNQNEVSKLSRQIHDLKRDLNLTLNSVSGTFVRTPRANAKAKKQDVSLPCPNCKTELTYKQRAKPSSYKFVECKSCKTKSLAQWNESDGFKLSIETLVDEQYNCPICGTSIKTKLSNFPHTKSLNECPSCHELSQLVRSAEKFNVHQLTKYGKEINADSHSSEAKMEFKALIDEDVLVRIKNDLPAQPWPKGIHKVVSEKLELPLNVTRNHINELIRRGEFKPQIDGVLYEPIKKI